jgi:hypothetical protein
MVTDRHKEATSRNKKEELEIVLKDENSEIMEGE